METKRLHKTHAGIAGEYLVAAELTRRGWVASLTLKNTQGIDVLASSSDGTRTVAIQVKCNQGSAPKWILGAKAEAFKADTLFYVFVRLHDGGVPDFHVVPSATVASFVAKDHRDWLSKLGRGGRPHNDNAIRNFRDRPGEFHGRWDLLGLE
jgi:hypothetical protein